MSSFNCTNVSQRADAFAPQLRSAGKLCKEDEAHVAELTSHCNAHVPETPDKIKAFSHRGPDVGQPRYNRWSNKNKSTHIVDNTADNNKNNNNNEHHDQDSSVEKCLRPGLYANKMTALIEEQRQLNYLSERRKPLGRSPAPLFEIITPLNGFGKPSSANQSSSSVNINNNYNVINNNNNSSSSSSSNGGGSIPHNVLTNVNNEENNANIINRNDSNGVKAAMNAWRDVEPMYEPGEHYDREYNWEKLNIDPFTYRFGVNNTLPSTTTTTTTTTNTTNLSPEYKKDSINTNVTSLLTSNSTNNDDLILVPKLVSDFYKTTSSEIGKSKSGVICNNASSSNNDNMEIKNNNHCSCDSSNYLRSNEQLSTKDVSCNNNGKAKNQTDNQLTVRELLTGWAEKVPTSTNLQTEDNFSKSNNICSSDNDNYLDDNNENKLVACEKENKPSVRRSENKSQATHSIPNDREASKENSHLTTIKVNKKMMKDEATAQELLQPCNYVQLGIESKYFAGSRSLESIQELCERVHFPLTKDDISEVYKCVVERDGECGIEQFKNAAILMGYM